MFCLPQWRDDGILLVSELGIAASDESEASCECCSQPPVITDALSFGRWAVVIMPAHQWREPTTLHIPEQRLSVAWAP